MQKLFLACCCMFLVMCSNIEKEKITGTQTSGRTELFDLSKKNIHTNFDEGEERLYLHALNSGFSLKSPVSEKAEIFRQRYQGQLFLNSLIHNRVSVSREEILRYYNKNGSSFTLLKEGVLVNHFLVKKKEMGDKIVNVLKTPKKTKEKNELFISNGVSAVIVYRGDLITELDEALFSHNNDMGVFGPILSQYGYHVIQVLSRFEKGSILPLSQVYDEIHQRIYQKKSSLIKLNILDSLRSTTP